MLPGVFVAVCALIVANALWTDLVAPLTSGQAMGPSAASQPAPAADGARDSP